MFDELPDGLKMTFVNKKIFLYSIFLNSNTVHIKVKSKKAALYLSYLWLQLLPLIYNWGI